MSIQIEIIGKIHHIAETVFVTDTFSKREFIVHVEDEKNSKYDDYIQMQMVMDNCDRLNGLHFQDEVKVQCNIRGRKYQRKDGSGEGYFNSMDAWKIEVIEKAHVAMPEPPPPETQTQPLPPKESAAEDLPF